MSQPRAQTLRLQSAVNRIVQALLRVPVLSRLIGARLMIIDVVGRKSGTRYHVPVAYTRQDDDLLVGTSFPWGRNLRTGEPVTVLLKGERRTAEVTVITDEPGVREVYTIITRDNHRFAAFNKIAIDDHGDPDPADLGRAWAAGARAFRLTPG